MAYIPLPDGKHIEWEPTTDLLCTYCRIPIDVASDPTEAMNWTNFMFDLADKEASLRRGEYWYFHKRCMGFEDALMSRGAKIMWGWFDMKSVLGLDSTTIKQVMGNIQKMLQKYMPTGVYDRLYEQWLPAIPAGKRGKIPIRPLYGPQPAIEFVCAQCDRACVPEDYSTLTLAWLKTEGPMGRHVLLLHSACVVRYKQEHRGLGVMPLPDLFDMNKHSYRDWVMPYVSTPLLDFFKPVLPPVRLKFGKDVWVCNANEFVLVESETRKPRALPEPKPSNGIQPRAKPVRPPQLPKEPKPVKPGRPGVVYLMQAEGWTEVKIGHGINALARLKLFQTGCPKSLRILREIKSRESAKLEGFLHDRYETYRRQGEWFDLPVEILEALLKEDFHDF